MPKTSEKPCNRDKSHKKDHNDSDNERDICDARCFSPCEQVILTVSADPGTVSRVGQVVTLRFRVTNITNRTIRPPLVIVSSWVGTLFLTDRSLAPGQTIEKFHQVTTTEANLGFGEITNISYVARGKRTGIPSQFDAGERISPVTTLTVTVLLADLDITGFIGIQEVGIPDSNIGIIINLNNRNNQTVNEFSMDLSRLFPATCPPTIRNNPNDLFTFGPPGSRILQLTPGKFIEGNTQFSTVEIVSANCGGPFIVCPNDVCSFEYKYRTPGGVLITRTANFSIIRRPAA